METLDIVIGVFCTALGGVLGYVAFLKGTKKDSKDEGKQDGTILTELGYIKGGVDDIKRKQEKQDEQYIGMSERVARVEESAKSAHHRIDRLEGREE